MSKYICLFIVMFPILSGAQVPQTLSYQGLLTDASGNPLSGTHTVLFNFYTASTGGTSAFSRGPLTVTTFQGLFTAIIGNGQGSNNGGLPTLGSTQYYLGIVADGGSELSPRVTLTAVPYAFTASSLDANASVSGAQVGTGINASNITAGTLPAAQIAAGSIDNTKLAAGIDASKITVGTLNVARLPNTANAVFDLSAAKSSINVPGGNNGSDRPPTPLLGAMRYNSTDSVLEYYNGKYWYYTTPKVALLKESDPGGTSGGNSSGYGTWVQRILNTKEGDTYIVSLNSNQFTLGPGDYVIDAICYGGVLGNFKLRLKNTTTNTTAAVGQNEYVDYGNLGTNNANLWARVAIKTTTVFQLEMYWNANPGGNSLGEAFAASGERDIYSMVKITKLRGQ